MPEGNLLLRRRFCEEFEKFGSIAAQMARWVGDSEDARCYFRAHIRRYLTTLEIIPYAGPNETLLELGSSFHQMTPLFVTERGFQTIYCADIWDGGPKQEVRRVPLGGPDHMDITVDNFDVETSPWPHPDARFDVVVCAEILEHLVHDPMFMLAEANRVMRFDGALVITTPNIASAKGVASILAGESPYVYGKFEMGGRSTDRHNREYTVNEVRRLVNAAGFGIEQLFTKNSWWGRFQRIVPQLAEWGQPTVNRGDNIFCLARKRSGVRTRYPEEFYARVGIQSGRRRADQTNSVDRIVEAAGSHKLARRSAGQVLDTSHSLGRDKRARLLTLTPANRGYAT